MKNYVVIITRNISVALTLGSSTLIFGQGPPPCPQKPGLYVQVSNTWQELPQEASPLVVQKMSGFYGLIYDKEFAGDSAFTALENPSDFCVVGANTATFSLEKAKIKKGKNRTIVQSGNYHDKKGDQSQQLAVITDEQGDVHLKSHALGSGQYILIVHGTISKPSKTSSGNSATDAMAKAMADSAAIVSSMTAGGGGVYFGFGVR